MVKASVASRQLVTAQDASGSPVPTGEADVPRRRHRKTGKKVGRPPGLGVYEQDGVRYNKDGTLYDFREHQKRSRSVWLASKDSKYNARICADYKKRKRAAQNQVEQQTVSVSTGKKKAKKRKKKAKTNQAKTAPKRKNG